MTPGRSTSGRRVAAVVLAAGRSERMGPENKLVCEIDGVPMICRSVDAYLGAKVAPVVVVTGHQAERVSSALGERPLSIVDCPDAELGLSASLRTGLDALPDDVEGAVVGLGDMPWVRPRDIDALVTAFALDDGEPICAPFHAGRRGNPVLWPRAYFDELRSLSGDAGARTLLGRYADRVRRVAASGAGVLQDVDTRAGLIREGL